VTKTKEIQSKRKQIDLNEKRLPMKSMMRRPSEALPTGWWKNVSPYGETSG